MTRRGNRTTRQIIAAMVVTTALCADRVSAAAPDTPTPRQARQTTGSLVQRLAQNLRRTVGDQLPSRLLPCRLATRCVALPPTGPAVSVGRFHQPTSPFQFRLPPPAA